MKLMKLLTPRISQTFNGNLYVSMVLVITAIIAISCTTSDVSDAYGQFEATETTISSESNGKLLQFTPDEGDRLTKSTQVGFVDTTRFVLQRDELEARLQSIEAKISNINAEVEVQKEELELAQSNLRRTKALHEDEAATEQNLDDAQTRVRTIKKRIDALQTQKVSVRAEINATEARIEQVNQQIRDAVILNPINGRVLTSFVEPFEVVQMGQPLYRIANLDTLILRVYVDGAQLPNIKLGQEVEVLVDKNANENQSLIGRISWIASEAEFTPEQIQTKEERVTQVYAVKVRVPNSEGILKIGMPGEVNF